MTTAVPPHGHSPAMISLASTTDSTPSEGAPSFYVPGQSVPTNPVARQQVLVLKPPSGVAPFLEFDDDKPP